MSMKNKKDKNKKIKKPNRVYAFFYALLAKLIRGLFRIRVINAENEPLEGGFMLVSNHASGFDPVLICASMQQQICFMGKKELFKIPILGGFLKSLGGYPIDRAGADISAIKITVNLLKEGKCVGMFPQGTRHPGKHPRETEVKNGVSLIAARSGADVLPVCIKTQKHKPKLFRRTYIIIGKLIKNEELGLNVENEKGNALYHKVAERIFADVCDLCDTEVENAKK